MEQIDLVKVGKSIIILYGMDWIKVYSVQR